jgi:hypothetical protein
MRLGKVWYDETFFTLFSYAAGVVTFEVLSTFLFLGVFSVFDFLREFLVEVAGEPCDFRLVWAI